MDQHAPDRDRAASLQDPQDPPSYRPSDRFWPYVDLPEQPTDEELATLDPDLRQALFETPRLRFSMTIVFPRFDGPDYPRAVELARGSAEYRETGSGPAFRHRARFWARDMTQLRALWALVGDLPVTDVLVDDRPVPFARELWLPLAWFLVS
jgi:hypothetical protein